MEKYIICGLFHKYFFTLFILVVIQIVNEAIYGFNYFENIFDEVKIFHNKGHEYFSKHILIHLFFSYIGLFVLTTIIYLYKVIILKNQSLICSFQYSQYIWIALISFAWVIADYFFTFYSLILGGLEFWFLELLIAFYLITQKFYIPNQIYQRLAMIINIFPLIIKFISIVLSIKLEKETSNLIYIKHLWLILVGIAIYFILALLRSFANLKFKEIINGKSHFQYEILMIYGFFGIAITSIVCLITSNFNCNIGEIQDYLCKVSENNDTKKFIDSVPIYLNILERYSKEDKTQKILEILVIIFGSLTFIANKYFYYIVLKYLDPAIFVFSFPLLFLLRKIALIINSLFISKSIFKEDVMGINKIKFFLEIIGDIFCLISFLVFSELILFKCGKYKENYFSRVGYIERYNFHNLQYHKDNNDPIFYYDDDGNLDIDKYSYI